MKGKSNQRLLQTLTSNGFGQTFLVEIGMFWDYGSLSTV